MICTNEMAVLTPVLKRLRSYHPVLEKIIFGLSLLGVLTVTHLWIQQGRDFEKGCFGFPGLDAGQMSFDCSAVVSSGAGTFLGLSNITWGLGFYLFVAVLTFAVFQFGKRSRAWVQGTRTASLIAGLIYSGYLVFVQVEMIGAFCALCLVSAGLVVLLSGTQGAALFLDDSALETTMTTRLFKRDLTVYVYLAAFTAVLVGADLTYFNAFPSGTDEQQRVEQGPESPAACELDTTAEPVADNGSSLVNFQDVTKGPSDASVTIIEYFDPNCPHCKTFHKTMKKLVAEYKDEVQFVFKPFPLRRSSLPEIQALYVANQEGKFSEMLEAQYARQDRSGISERDLQAIASEIDMNAEVLMSQINQGKYRKKVVAQYNKATKIGVKSTPTVLVNGHFVKSESRTQECFDTFIQRAQEGTLGGRTSSE